MKYFRVKNVDGRVHGDYDSYEEACDVASELNYCLSDLLDNTWEVIEVDELISNGLGNEI